MIGPDVIHLNVACRPTTVLWGVIAIIVDSVERMFFGGAVTHVGVEELKPFAPPFTNSDTPSAVPWPVLTAFFVAPLYHRVISNVFGRLPNKPRVIIFDPAIRVPAAARFRLADLQVMRINDHGLAAIALTEKTDLPGFGRDPLYYEKPPTTLTRKIVEFTPSHGFTSIMVSNHCEMLGNKVIDVLRSAAKPIRAWQLYQL